MQDELSLAEALLIGREARNLKAAFAACPLN